MAKYEIRQDDRNRRKYVIGRKRLELHWPAIAVCLLLAFLLWLFVAGGADQQEPPEIPTGVPGESVAEPPANPGTQAEGSA